MIYKIKDFSKVEKLFNNWPYPNWNTVMNQKVEIYADDPDNPKSAIGFLGRWCYCAGKPNKQLIMRKQKEWFGLFPQDKNWKKLIEECFPDGIKDKRYAINHDANFDRANLQSLIDALPEGYEIKKFDSKIYNLCKKATDEDVQELIDWFKNKKEFFELALAYAVIKDGKLVGGASTAYRFPKGIDIEIDIDKHHRRKGLASAAAATLILDCLDRGWRPTWDAANMKSVHLSEKLGYTFAHEYYCYWINPVLFRVIKNPDKSKWESYVGKYETNCKDFKLKEIWMKDGNLYGLASNEYRNNFKFKLLLIGENTFGRSGGEVVIKFENDAYIVDDIVCKKIA